MRLFCPRPPPEAPHVAWAPVTARVSEQEPVPRGRGGGGPRWRSVKRSSSKHPGLLRTTRRSAGSPTQRTPRGQVMGSCTGCHSGYTVGKPFPRISAPSEANSPFERPRETKKFTICRGLLLLSLSEQRKRLDAQGTLLYNRRGQRNAQASV